MFICSGWRRLRYFDLDKYQIDGRSRCLAYIEKLGDQWKVIYDLKPTADQFELCVAGYYIDFSLEQGCVSLHSYKKVLGESMQLPEVGKWTRFELSHEFDETAGNYILSLSIGGVEVLKAEDEDNVHDKPDVARIYDPNDSGEIYGFIRRIVFLEKS